MRPLVAAAAFLLVVGCGTDGSDSEFSTADPNELEAALAAECEESVASAQLRGVKNYERTSDGGLRFAYSAGSGQGPCAIAFYPDSGAHAVAALVHDPSLQTLALVRYCVRIPPSRSTSGEDLDVRQALSGRNVPAADFQFGDRAVRTYRNGGPEKSQLLFGEAGCPRVPSIDSFGAE